MHKLTLLVYKWTEKLRLKDEMENINFFFVIPYLTVTIFSESLWSWA